MTLFNPLQIRNYLTYSHDYHLKIGHYVFCMDLTQTAINLLYSIKCLAFQTRYELNICLAFPNETEYVYCAVRAKYILGFSNRDWVFTARYELNICLAFPNETECLYCAVRAKYLLGFSNRDRVFTAWYQLNICLAFPTETECLLRGTS